MVVALFIIVSVTFFISKALPGTPFADPKLSPQVREQLFEKYGLDEPLYVQYAKYMANVAQGDLGNSFYLGQIGVAIDPAAPARIRFHREFRP